MNILKYIIFVVCISIVNICSGQSPSTYCLTLSENSILVTNNQNNILSGSIKILKKKRFLIKIYNPNDSLVRMNIEELKPLFRLSILDSFGEPVPEASFSRWHYREARKVKSKNAKGDPDSFIPSIIKKKKTINLYFWIESKHEDAYAGALYGYSFEKNKTYFIKLQIKQRDNSKIESNTIKLFTR